MKQSTCGAVFCQPGGDELKHDIMNIVKISVRNISPTLRHVGNNAYMLRSLGKHPPLCIFTPPSCSRGENSLV